MNEQDDLKLAWEVYAKRATMSNLLFSICLMGFLAGLLCYWH